jgi:hypothetical protein
VAPWWWFLCKPKHVVAASIIILYVLITLRFLRCVYYLDNKVIDIIDARCNHGDFFFEYLQFIFHCWFYCPRWGAWDIKGVTSKQGNLSKTCYLVSDWKVSDDCELIVYDLKFVHARWVYDINNSNNNRVPLNTPLFLNLMVFWPCIIV